jgi:hypothetical protein
MFKNLTVVSSACDQATRFKPVTDWHFAAELTMVPVTRAEMGTLAQEYVLLFTADTPTVPVALLGVDGKNSYVAGDGSWRADAVPARVKNFPFNAVEVDDQIQVMCDRDAPQLAAADGEPLFTKGGAATPVLERVRLQAEEVRTGMAHAAVLAAQLDAAGLLTDAASVITAGDGMALSLAGFKVMNRDAVAALDDATKSRLMQNGALPMLVQHQISLSNLAQLAPAAPKKASKPKAAAKAAGAEAAATDAPAAKKPRATKPKAAAVAADAAEAPKKPRAKKAA